MLWASIVRDRWFVRMFFLLISILDLRRGLYRRINAPNVDNRFCAEDFFGRYLPEFMYTNVIFNFMTIFPYCGITRNYSAILSNSSTIAVNYSFMLYRYQGASKYRDGSNYEFFCLRVCVLFLFVVMSGGLCVKRGCGFVLSSKEEGPPLCTFLPLFFSFVDI